MVWISRCIVCFLLLCGRASVGYALSLDALVSMLDVGSPQLFQAIKKELARPDLSGEKKAQILQILSLAHHFKDRKDKAQDIFWEALRLDERVKLLGQMSPPVREEYEKWRSTFLRIRIKKLTQQRNFLPSLVLLGVGVAGLVAGVGLGAAAQGKRQDAQKGIDTGGMVEEVKALYESAGAMGLGANLAYGGGGALLVAGGVWLVVELSKPIPSLEKAATTKHSVSRRFCGPNVLFVTE